LYKLVLLALIEGTAASSTEAGQKKKNKKTKQNN